MTILLRRREARRHRFCNVTTMKQVAYGYILKMWITTVLLAPALVLSLDYFFDLRFLERLLINAELFVVFSLITGFALSIPVFALSAILFFALARKHVHPVVIKLLCAAVAVILTCVTFRYLVRWSPFVVFYLTLCYGVLIVLSASFFRLRAYR